MLGWRNKVRAGKIARKVPECGHGKDGGSKLQKRERDEEPARK